MSDPSRPLAASLLNPKGLVNGDEPAFSSAPTAFQHLSSTSDMISSELDSSNTAIATPSLDIPPPTMALENGSIKEDPSTATDSVAEPTTKENLLPSSDSTVNAYPSPNLSVPAAEHNTADMEVDRQPAATHPEPEVVGDELLAENNFTIIESDTDNFVSPAARYRKSPLPNDRSPMEPAMQAQSNGSAQPPAFVFTSTAGENESNSEDDAVGVGSFIERSHNLAAREDSPAKRQKLSSETPLKKSRTAFKDFSSGSAITASIKDRRRKDNEADPKAPHDIITIDDTPAPEPSSDAEMERSIIDLTTDDGKKAADPDEQVVCYGKLDGAKVSIHRIPRHKDHKGWTSDQKNWKSLQCALFRVPGGTNFVIHVRDWYGMIFGTVDVRVARALTPLLDSQNVFPNFRVDARLDPHPRAPNTHFDDSISEQWPISLNCYGQRRHASLVGGELRKRNVFLGAPTGVPFGVEIFNPHAAERATLPRARPSKFSGFGGYVTRTNEEVEKDINTVFDRVKNHDDLGETLPTECVKTPLLAHQLQCLTFMADREAEHDFQTEEDDTGGHSRSLWRSRIKRSGHKAYYNVITGNEDSSPPPQVRGGILADQMGLGKTLETLAHFASTMEEARQVNEMEATTVAACGSELESLGTTLLICPKNVMSNWEDQIATHLAEGSVKYHLFYGSNRCQNLSELRKYDLIMTTYSTVSSEMNRKSSSVLRDANWFRIILDEGHMIREQSTQQSKAVCELSATRRWVLTGTPVQNRLEDLGALVKFLRLTPFDVPSNFAQYIIAPLKSGNVEGVKRLRTLVDVITLRRLKDRIDLLPREDTVMKLEFTSEERTLYSWVNQDAKNRVRLMDDRHKRGGRQMGSILRLISCLRLISDHGKELVREDELPDTKGISQSNPLVLDEDEERTQPPVTAHQAYEMFRLVSENDANDCIKCSKKVVACDEDDDPDKAYGVMLRCYDLVCTDCLRKFKRDMEGQAINGRFQCPMCGESCDFCFFELTQTGVDQAEAERTEAQLHPKKAKRLGKYEKPHTKTWALLGELNSICHENEAMGHSPPVKSVVFTEWTSHIDLIEVALHDHASHIKYVRLDGTMSRKQQTAAMDKLRDDDNITLMLISIKAGGVGINLTAASRVFVMEPNWNPAAEAQAVDRVHRLGQKRVVKVTRFIMADSIEEQIAKRQSMKKDLADMSMNRKVENIKAKMDRFKELFR